MNLILQKNSDLLFNRIKLKRKLNSLLQIIRWFLNRIFSKTGSDSEEISGSATLNLGVSVEKNILFSQILWKECEIEIIWVDQVRTFSKFLINDSAETSFNNFFLVEFYIYRTEMRYLVSHVLWWHTCVLSFLWCTSFFKTNFIFIFYQIVL